MEVQIIPLNLSYLGAFLGTLKHLDGGETLSMQDARRLFFQIIPERRWIFIVVRNDSVFATASLFVEYKFTHMGGRAAHIEDVVTHPKYRSLGYASMLIERCIETARELNCYKVVLDCKSDKMSFYEKFGFKMSEQQMRMDLI